MTEMDSSTPTVVLQPQDVEKFRKLYPEGMGDECCVCPRKDGRFPTEDKSWSAQIFAWVLEYGRYPYQKHIHTTCGTKNCVNIKHLAEKQRRDDWEFFLSCTDVRGDDECWIWDGERGGDVENAGIYLSDGRHIKPQRYAWETANGRKLGKHFLRSTCHTEGCVNPKHWYAGPGPADVERFWSRVVKQDGDGCWEWQGSLNISGYGLISIDGKNELTHRFSWELENGPIPDGLYACHHCDSRICVRPSHIFIGTHMDNMQDMIAKGRDHKNPNVGEACPQSKLTNEAVLAIRSSVGVSKDELAERYGVSRAAIVDVLMGRRWKHLL